MTTLLERLRCKLLWKENSKVTCTEEATAMAAQYLQIYKTKLVLNKSTKQVY